MQKPQGILLTCLICLAALGCNSVEQAAPTSLPTTIPPPGWHLLENNGFQIWLPESYVGGTDLDMDAIIQQLAQEGPIYAKAAQSIKQGGSSYIVFAIDTNNTYSGNITNMIVGKEIILSNLDIGKYIDMLATNLLSKYGQYHILSKDVVASSRYPIGRLIAEINTSPLGDVKQIMYAIKNGGVVWQIMFTTPAVEFQQRLPAFEQIANTVSMPYSSETSNGAGQNNQGIVFLFGVALVIIGLILKVAIKPREKIEQMPLKQATSKSAVKKKERARKVSTAGQTKNSAGSSLPKKLRKAQSKPLRS